MIAMVYTSVKQLIQVIILSRQGLCFTMVEARR
jgi:hypothetical protein